MQSTLERSLNEKNRGTGWQLEGYRSQRMMMMIISFEIVREETSGCFQTEKEKLVERLEIWERGEMTNGTFRGRNTSFTDTAEVGNVLSYDSLMFFIMWETRSIDNLVYLTNTLPEFPSFRFPLPFVSKQLALPLTCYLCPAETLYLHYGKRYLNPTSLCFPECRERYVFPISQTCSRYPKAYIAQRGASQNGRRKPLYFSSGNS